MPRSDRTGLIATDVLLVLNHIHSTGPVMTKSNAARTYADALAEASSRGFVTVLLKGVATRQWRLTPRGLATLNMELA